MLGACRRCCEGARPALLALVVLLTACAPEPVEETAAGASPLRARLLSADQYHNVIAAVFGEDVAGAVIPPMPPLQRTDGLLASGAATAGLTSDQLSQIQQAAALIAATVVDEEHRDFLLPCVPAADDAPDDACTALFLEASARLLQRRPVDAGRLADLVAIAAAAARETGSFHEGLALALEAVLISPEFLFIIDRDEPDPQQPGARHLDAWSLASRLSFFLWNGPPDEALLAAAASGALHAPDGLAAQVERMLASPLLVDGMRAFFDDMLAFDEFDSLAKDATVYPMVTGRTLADAREQTLRTIVDHLLVREDDYRDLFTTRQTFMSRALAPVYGTAAGPGWTHHEFSEDSHRRGLLTHVSFLAANSHAVRSSPTLRGKALRELFLCQHVPDPPPNVDFSKIEDAGDVPTARERLQVHNTNPSCAGCHLITDPMGLSLENFDGAGAWRDTENGAAIEVAGELDGVFYDDVGGLAEAMRDHPKLAYCLVNRLYAYGTGGPVTLKYDRDTLKDFEEGFAQAQYRLPALLSALATSDAFVRVRVVEEERSVASRPGDGLDARPTVAAPSAVETTEIVR